MSGRRLDPGELPKDERRGRHERHLLALTGGGYRGLFSAEVLGRVDGFNQHQPARKTDDG